LWGAPIRLHWTLPLGAFVLGRFAFLPAFWLGFLGLILIHELGHALLVVRYRLGLTEIAVHGMGGYCRHQRSGSPFQEAVVAWGGVAAQAILLLVAYAWLLLFGPPRSSHSALLLHVFTSTNLLVICINLLPIEPLDGKKAWRLVGILRDRWRAPPSARAQESPPQRQRRAPCCRSPQDAGECERKNGSHRAGARRADDEGQARSLSLPRFRSFEAGAFMVERASLATEQSNATDGATSSSVLVRGSGTEVHRTVRGQATRIKAEASLMRS